MLGTNYFGQSYFGQGYALTFILGYIAVHSQAVNRGTNY